MNTNIIQMQIFHRSHIIKVTFRSSDFITALTYDLKYTVQIYISDCTIILLSFLFFSLPQRKREYKNVTLCDSSKKSVFYLFLVSIMKFMKQNLNKQ